MATIHPFKALRPNPEVVSEVASLPYDVMNSHEAREMAKNNHFSFLHVVRPEINLSEGVDLYSEEVYQAGANAMRNLIAKKALIREKNPSLYVYQQEWRGHVQTGLVAGTSAQEYNENKIKKHEFTREKKENDRLKHVRTLNANTGPVFLAYRSRQEVDFLLMKITKEKPVYDFTGDDEISHRLWVVSDEEMIKKLQQAFKDVPALYVADGHHRSASGAKVAGIRAQANPCHTGDEEYNYFLSVIFPHNQLKILDYNRVVKDLGSMNTDAFIAKIKEKFNISSTENPKPDKPKKIGMYTGGRWYYLEPKKGTYPENDPVDSLDVAILQNNLLSEILGIEDPRKDERIAFVGGIRGVRELEMMVDKGWAVAFSMYPTSMKELMEIADSGRTMPPKSTWFEPKLRSGLIIHSLD
ncbi:MAG: DUF1015 family protein [Deltaproteobacteria bacterium]|jgi:uncharacterized protein (DUF1015 family)|nr:DUF1015 family protein [Deltaproteobacteria bacterium]